MKACTERFKEYPDYMAEEAYAAVYFVKAAVQKAGTTEADKIITAVEREPLAWETPEGSKIMGRQDRAVVEDVVWGETTFDPKYGFSVIKEIQSIQAEQICRTPEELQQVRAGYLKRLNEKK